MASTPSKRHLACSLFLPCSAPICVFLLLLASAPTGTGLHHMKMVLPTNQRSQNRSLPLVVTNQCDDSIWPGFATQSGTGPDETGFELRPGQTHNQTVSGDWQGRVWGRTNCTFDQSSDDRLKVGGSYRPGKACGTGDCNGKVACEVTGDTPVTLAEFTMDGGDGQCYYDISLVDGYNVPMAITMLPNGNPILEKMPPNLTNPSCMGTGGLLQPPDFSPYGPGNQQFLGTNSSFPLAFEKRVSNEQATRWCPWDLQLNPPSKPGDGVYPYPDDNIERPIFNPCYSACAKDNKPEDCCTGKYNSPSSCSPSLFSKNAKKVCPDAYSFAFDDKKSTFVIPIGAGFEIVFCPGGRSTNILATK